MIYVCFTTENGHFSALAILFAFDPLQTFTANLIMRQGIQNGCSLHHFDALD